LKESIIQVAEEVLGRRRKNYNRRGLLKTWNQDTADLITDKKKVYLKFLQTKTEADQTEYKRIRAMVKIETSKINRNSWDMYK
jgi:hypothetical protein